jgi:hypothetical protein
MQSWLLACIYDPGTYPEAGKSVPDPRVKRTGITGPLNDPQLIRAWMEGLFSSV